MEEKNQNEQMKNIKGVMAISTTLNLFLWHKAQKYGIKWSDALRRGISLMIDEIENNDGEFTNPKNYKEKIAKLSSKLEEFARLNEQLQKDKAIIETKYK